MKEVLEYLSKFDFPTIAGMFAISWYFTRDLKTEFRAETQAIKDAAFEQSKRTDQLYELFVNALSEQNKRIDQLHQNFIDLLKAKNKGNK